MYANLKVNIDGTDHYAWKLDITDGEVVVHLDANDGDSQHAEEAGEQRFAIADAPPMSITADF